MYAAIKLVLLLHADDHIVVVFLRSRTALDDGEFASGEKDIYAYTHFGFTSASSIPTIMLSTVANRPDQINQTIVTQKKNWVENLK